MKKKYINVGKKILFLALLIGLISATSDERFQQVIDASPNDTIKNKLMEFQENGIELPVASMEGYDAEKIIVHAKTFIGTPHKMGGITNQGIDCSGLVMVSHAHVGVSLPHIAHEQARYGIIIPDKEKLEKGDLVFFYHSYATNNFITHSGIYLGEGSFIHSSASRGVIISKLSDAYWKERYLFATRLSK